jgi:carbamoyltransferase
MWYQGGAEIGPRALGNRSILALPSSVNVRDFINSSVKTREWFRPLAPMVPLELADRYFASKAESPFMLLSPPVTPLTGKQAPAIVHRDGSARVQTVTATEQPVIHALLHEVNRLSGCPIVLNTSFNTRSEPIVESPDEALASFIASPVEHLFLECIHVEKK